MRLREVRPDVRVEVVKLMDISSEHSIDDTSLYCRIIGKQGRVLTLRWGGPIVWVKLDCATRMQAFHYKELKRVKE